MPDLQMGYAHKFGHAELLVTLNKTSDKLIDTLLQVFSAMEVKKHGTPRVFEIHNYVKLKHRLR